MTASIVIIVIGLLLIAAAVLLRKKLGILWLCSCVAAGVLLSGCGGWFYYGEVRQARQDQESLYFGLRYLEQSQLESANYYLKKVDASDSFVSAAARSLLEAMRGNELTARIDLDIAVSLARGSEQEKLLAALRAFSAENYGQISVLAGELLRTLGLPEAQMKTMDLYMQLENGYADVDDVQLMMLGLGQNDRERLNIGNLLSRGSYGAAVTAAVQLADSNPSEENRLLLAETVAESAYHGVALSSAAFFGGGEENAERDPSIVREREELQEQLQQAQSNLALLEITLAGTEDEAELQALNQQKLELTQEIQSLSHRMEHLYVYRAFNAIADLHSLNAQLVRARLYYALLDYDRAVETLLETSNSLQARLSPDHNLRNSLQIVANAYRNDNIYYGNTEFQDAMTRLLTAPFEDLMYFTKSSLTRDFVQRIVADQKVYGRSLVVSGVDTSDYPTVRVTLSGSFDVLQQVVRQKEITVRDTRRTVTYTAELTDGSTADICMLLDRSGSMSGRPIQNLRDAVVDFIMDMGEGTSLSLVAFEHYTERLTELTQDKASLLAAAENLYGGGGTDITAAIREGLAVLQEAGSNRVMLLMTDGQSSIDFTVVDEAAVQNITIYTIGFGSVNDSLLQEIADRTGGQYVRADSSEELSNVYAALQRIIGNTVTLEYTVADAETLERYFFLEAPGHTVHRDYFLTTESGTVQVYTSNTYFVTPEQLRSMKDRGTELGLELIGEGLTRVQAATVGGLPATITSQDSSRLRLSVAPDLTAGWQTIELQLADGGTLVLEHLLLVGETQTWRNVRLGSLLIPSAQGILPGDGTLVLAGSGIQIRENSADGAASSLDLSFNGTLILPWNSAASAEAMGTDLGDRGTVYGFGVVTINRGDSAYAQNAPATVARGGVIFTCGPEQSQMTSAAETGVR